MMNPRKLLDKYKNRKPKKNEVEKCIETLDKFTEPDKEIIFIIVRLRK